MSTVRAIFSMSDLNNEVLTSSFFDLPTYGIFCVFTFLYVPLWKRPVQPSTVISTIVLHRQKAIN